MRFLRLALFILGLTGAVLGAAIPASADVSPQGQDVEVHNHDLGFAVFTANGDHVTVCDAKPDGKGAVAYLYPIGNLDRPYLVVRDPKYDDHCMALGDSSIPEGRRVGLLVCAYWTDGDGRHDYGPPCTGDSGTT